RPDGRARARERGRRRQVAGVEFVYGVITGAYSLDAVVRWGGYTLLVVIVFIETGLLVGFFLPGDSLLITAGLVAATGMLNIWWIDVVLIVAAVAGDSTDRKSKRLNSSHSQTSDAVFCLKK